MPKFSIHRTLQPADFEPISFGVEGCESREEAYREFNELQADIVRCFNEQPRSSIQFKKGGEPATLAQKPELPPKGKK